MNKYKTGYMVQFDIMTPAEFQEKVREHEVYMNKATNTIALSNTLSLSKCSNGFWLWDETRGRNLAMRSKTKQAAILQALEYYQDRCKEVEERLRELEKISRIFTDGYNDIYND